MITMLRTTLQPDMLITDEVLSPIADNNTSYAKVGNTDIPTYCDISFYINRNGEQPEYLETSGGGMCSGNPLNSYALVMLKRLDASPNNMKATVTIATLSPQLNVFTEKANITIDVPRTDQPLVDAALDLDVGPTVVKHIVISRTPLLLVVQVYHQPAEESGDHSFSITSYGDVVLKDDFSDVSDLDDKSLVCVEKAFLLEKDDPLPKALRLHNNGKAAKDLKVDLTTGTVDVLAQ